MDKFTQTFLYRIAADWNMDNVIICSQYDLLAVQGFRWDNVNNDTWGELKKLNPNILIFPYYQSRIDNSEDHKQNPYKGTLGRWDISRGHSMGTCNGNDDFFAKNASGNRVIAATPNNFIPNYGNERFMKYWLEGWRTDNLDKPWESDGVMIDEPHLHVENSGAQSLPINFDWKPGVRNWINNVTSELDTHNTLVWINVDTIKSQATFDAFIDLDTKVTNLPHIAVSEGAYVVSWGYGDCQFYPEKVWLLQVQVSNEIHNMKYGVQSTVGGLFRTSETGLDNYNRTLTLYDTIWYGLCSYHLGKNTVDNNTYFGFTREPYSSGEYYGEFDIDLGEALDTFKVTNIGGNNIYFREFELGYVYVNPTRNDVSNISLPVTCKRLTHDNFRDNPTTIPDNDMLSLESNRGTMLLKTVPDQPCDGVVCDNICDGYDLWSQKCNPATGICEPYNLIEQNSTTCGYVPPDDPCEGVVCPIICVGDDMWSQRCDPATGQCELYELIEQDSINCKIPDKIPTDETTIKTYLILGGVGMLALAMLLAKKR